MAAWRPLLLCGMARRDLAVPCAHAFHLESARHSEVDVHNVGGGSGLWAVPEKVEQVLPDDLNPAEELAIDCGRASLETPVRAAGNEFVAEEQLAAQRQRGSLCVCIYAHFLSC